jgi:ligand-binding sensor domain-containing protein
MAIADDTEGNIWFGTNNGVLKFDGTNWTTFPFEDLIYGSAYAIDANGEIWIGTGFVGSSHIPYG